METADFMQVTVSCLINWTATCFDRKQVRTTLCLSNTIQTYTTSTYGTYILETYRSSYLYIFILHLLTMFKEINGELESFLTMS